jgi:uncharacterized protein (DUF2141 family)
MKFISIKLVLIIIFTTISIFAQDTTKIENNAGKFILSVVGFESNDGKAMIALFNSEEGYSETGENFKSNALEIEDLKTEWVIEGLPFGEYAIKLYHDENGNNKMDRNMLGIPSEDYGFSNNASGSFGPADYEDAKFVLNQSVQQHEINLD